jgi:hypothetical protein
VCEPERVSDLVRRELPEAREGELHGVIARARAGPVGADEPFEDQAVLAHSL